MDERDASGDLESLIAKRDELARVVYSRGDNEKIDGARRRLATVESLIAEAQRERETPTVLHEAAPRPIAIEAASPRRILSPTFVSIAVACVALLAGLLIGLNVPRAQIAAGPVASSAVSPPPAPSPTPSKAPPAALDKFERAQTQRDRPSFPKNNQFDIDSFRLFDSIASVSESGEQSDVVNVYAAKSLGGDICLVVGTVKPATLVAASCETPTTFALSGVSLFWMSFPNQLTSASWAPNGDFGAGG